jgi:putative Mg2+ transporter-C (MgtC) family protein
LAHLSESRIIMEKLRNMLRYLERLDASFNFDDIVLIFISIVIGLIIGAEREYKNKTAGLRTLMLVSVGSCTFTILSVQIGVANPDRLAANILTGIGFLGAGAIFRDENKINGVTTACTIWVTAALGMCIGSGHIYLGLLATAVVLMGLMQLVVLEHWIVKRHKVHIYKITTHYDEQVFSRFEQVFADHGLKAVKLLQTKENNELTVNWQVAGPGKQHEALTSFLFGDVTVRQLVI